MRRSGPTLSAQPEVLPVDQIPSDDGDIHFLTQYIAQQVLNRAVVARIDEA